MKDKPRNKNKWMIEKLIAASTLSIINKPERRGFYN
jgi:hypothetical protein